MNAKRIIVAVVLAGASMLAAWRLRRVYAEEEYTEIGAGFFIAKNENRNQVHYAVRVDESCVPLSDQPMRGYWRMLERSPTETAPLLQREQRLYGIGTQRVTQQRATGGRVEMTLRAVSSRNIVVETRRMPNGTCVAESSTSINNAPSRLTDVFVVISGLSVSEIQINGRSASGAAVQEKISP